MVLQPQRMHRGRARNQKALSAPLPQPPTAPIRSVLSRARRPRVPMRRSGVAGGRSAGALRPTLPCFLCPGPPGGASLHRPPHPGQGDSDERRLAGPKPSEGHRSLADPGSGRTAVWGVARQRNGAAEGCNDRCEHRPPGCSREAALYQKRCLASERLRWRLSQGCLQPRGKGKRFSGSWRLVVQRRFSSHREGHADAVRGKGSWTLFRGGVLQVASWAGVAKRGPGPFFAGPSRAGTGGQASWQEGGAPALPVFRAVLCASLRSLW